MRELIEKDLIAARRARDSQRLVLLQMLISALNYEKIRLGAVLSNEQEVAVLKKEAKKRSEAISIYKQAGREDAAKQEEFELSVLNEYLPEQMSEDEVKVVIDKLEIKTGLSGGPLVGAVMKELSGKADGSLVARLVSARK